MSKQLMKATQIKVDLSLNVITQTETGLRLAVIPLLTLTALIMAIWRGMVAINTIRFQMTLWWLDFQAGCEIIYAVTAIAVNAIIFGLGWRL